MASNNGRSYWLRVSEHGSNLLLSISGVMVAMLGAITTAGALQRYFLRRPEPYTYEIALVLLVIASLVAFPGVQRAERNVKLEFLVMRLPAAAQLALRGVIVPAVVLLCASPVCVYGWRAAWRALEMGEVSASVLRIPLFPIKVWVPIGFALLALVGAVQLARGVAGLVGTRAHQGVTNKLGHAGTKTPNA